MINLSPADRRFVQRQLDLLPSQTKAAQDKEIGDLMGQLKNVRLSFCFSFQMDYELIVTR